MRIGLLLLAALAWGCSGDGDSGTGATGGGGAGAGSGGGGAAGSAGGGTGGSGGAGGSGAIAGAGGTGAIAGTGGSGAIGGSGGGGAIGGSGGAGGGYVPDPIPTLSEEPAPACPAQTPSGQFQFLDDTCGAKLSPTFVDRELACPVIDPSAVVPLTGGGNATYVPSSQTISVDTTSLAGLAPSGAYFTVILIRRVGGVPHYRVLSTGNHDDAYQPWSTTKWLAAANAASSLRIASSYGVGLTASVAGKPLGDLVTSIANYDDSPYSSNALGRYFHDIGGRKRANDLIHTLWLKRPASETFGGNYGAASPPLGYTFKEPAGASVTITPDATAGPANHLSSFTIAEALKRVVLHREEPTERLPAIQWADVKTLLYGAEGSTKYGPWGGLAADTAIYLQAAHDIAYLEKRSQGRWRIFSKLGLGTGGQFLNVGYACLPVLDPAGKPVPGWGRELVIAAHLPTGGATWAERDRILARAYRKILIRVVDGRL